MIGIVIPVHDEEQLLERCLRAAAVAARHPGLAGETVRIVTALDACRDGSARIAERHRVSTVRLFARNVGRARAAGARYALEGGARWLACTDADTEVAPDWLVAQLALGADAVCGPVAVDDWSMHPAHVRELHLRHYVDADGHRHIHGANLGVSAGAYLRAGGFDPLARDEDVALVAALQRTGAHIAWSAAPRVITSARVASRARGGFADTLAALRLACVPEAVRNGTAGPAGASGPAVPTPAPAR